MWDTLRKARLSLRNSGLARTAQRALQRAVPDWLFDINSLIAIEIDFAEWRQPPTAAEWPHRWADESDLEVLTRGGLSETEVRAFFAQGARAALCAKDGKLVGYTWYPTSDWTAFGWIRIVLEGEVYAAAAYIAPEFRGRSLHNETRRFAYPALAALGYTRLVSFAEHLNRSTMRAGRTSNRRYIGRLSYVRLLGLVIFRLDGKWGAGFWNRRRPMELSFDVFDRESFRLSHKDARSGLDGPTGLNQR
jgi:hypothetical protein